MLNWVGALIGLVVSILVAVLLAPLIPEPTVATVFVILAWVGAVIFGILLIVALVRLTTHRV